MRHKIAGNRLGRFSSWRKATMRDIAKAALERQRISVSHPRAKEARKLVDQLITLGKKGTLADRRRAFAILCDHQLVSDLFNKIAPRFRSRNGGYTRIIPSAQRRGDGAHMVYLELTEKEEVIVSKPRTKAARLKKDIEAPAPTEAGQPLPPEAPIEEHKEEKKPLGPKPGTEKLPQKRIAPHEKGRMSKGFLGGIRKMFRRKVGE